MAYSDFGIRSGSTRKMVFTNSNVNSCPIVVYNDACYQPFCRNGFVVSFGSSNLSTTCTATTNGTSGVCTLGANACMYATPKSSGGGIAYFLTPTWKSFSKPFTSSTNPFIYTTVTQGTGGKFGTFCGLTLDSESIKKAYNAGYRYVVATVDAVIYKSVTTDPGYGGCPCVSSGGSVSSGALSGFSGGLKKSSYYYANGFTHGGPQSYNYCAFTYPITSSYNAIKIVAGLPIYYTKSVTIGIRSMNIGISALKSL